MKRFLLLFLLSFFSISILQSQSYTKSDIIIYISKYKNAAIKKMNEYKIPASITLAQGILESGAGTSELALNANNHFGIKCGGSWSGETYTKDDDTKDECFRKYPSIEDCYNDHSLFLKNNKRYASLFDNNADDYISWAKGLQDAGYATNPDYSKILVRVIEEYELYNYDKVTPRSNQPVVNQPVHIQTQGDDVVIIQGITYRPTTTQNDRKVYVNNHTRFVVAKANDSFSAIARDFFSDEAFLRRYNDLSKDAQLNEGDIIYIESKRSKGEQDFHVVAQGETLWQISQVYAMKMKSLAKLNGLNTKDQPRVGENLWLKKRRPASSKPSY
jgi:LysM repeat protein